MVDKKVSTLPGVLTFYSSLKKKLVMELDDIVKNVKDFFIAHAPGSNDGKTFLSFEPLGHMVSPDDFKLNGNFDPIIAASEVTVLSNFIPQITDLLNPDLLQSTIDTYASMIDSMQFYDKNITGDKTPYFGQFGAMKSAAAQKKPTYDPVTLTGSTVIASPSTWYDPNSNVWAQKSFTQSSTTSIASHSVAPAALSNMKLQWKLNPVAQKIAFNPQVTKIFNNINLVNKINLTAERLSIKPGVSIGASAFKVATSAVSIKPATVTAFKAPVQTNTVPIVDKQLLNTINLSIPLVQRVGLVRQLGQPINIQSQSVQSSSGFEISFSYCMVTLQRPWMLPQVFNLSKLWYSLSVKAGFYSTGEMGSTNNGAMRALPKAMIVIKDLKIKASNWSENDKHILQSAIGFGSFNLTSSTFDATTSSLTAPGVQIIGWICEVLPKLPYNDDPNLA